MALLVRCRVTSPVGLTLRHHDVSPGDLTSMERIETLMPQMGTLHACPRLKHIDACLGYLTFKAYIVTPRCF